jgi:hypothetical protein
MAQSNPADFEIDKTFKECSRWRYMTDHAADVVESHNYFHNSAQGRLAYGDEIQVVCVDDEGVYTRATLEVVSHDKIHTTVALVGNAWRTVGTPESRQSTSGSTPVHRGGGWWDVVAEDGTIIAKKLRKAGALKLAA